MTGKLVLTGPIDLEQLGALADRLKKPGAHAEAQVVIEDGRLSVTLLADIPEEFGSSFSIDLTLVPSESSPFEYRGR